MRTKTVTLQNAQLQNAFYFGRLNFSDLIESSLNSSADLFGSMPSFPARPFGTVPYPAIDPLGAVPRLADNPAAPTIGSMAGPANSDRLRAR